MLGKYCDLMLNPVDLVRFRKDYPHFPNSTIRKMYPSLTSNQLQYLACRHKLLKTKSTKQISAGKIIFTPEEEKFIRDNFDTMTNPQIARALGKKLTKLRDKCREMKLKRMEMEYWTDEQVQFLKENYTRMGDVEIAELFDQVYHKNKGWTKKHIEKKRRYLKLKRTKSQISEIHSRNVQAGRFSINHWKRWADNIAPIGEKRIWKSKTKRPYIVIKTEEGFVHYARWLWIQHYGVPPEGMVVTVKGDPINTEMTINDLELIDRAESAYRNTQKLSDRYVAGILTHNDPELRQEILENYPEIIELKRKSITLNREINGKLSN